MVSNAEWCACAALEHFSGDRARTRPSTTSTLISPKAHTTPACLAGALRTSKRFEKVAASLSDRDGDSRYTPKKERMENP